MRVVAVSQPRVLLWPRFGLVSLTDQLVISTDSHGELWLPRGMRSDGASVPAPLWPVLEATPTQLLLMGIGHDGAYRLDASWSREGEAVPITRPEADDLARALALYSACSELDAAKIRWGLGVGASAHWHRKRLDWRPTAT